MKKFTCPKCGKHIIMCVFFDAHNKYHYDNVVDIKLAKDKLVFTYESPVFNVPEDTKAYYECESCGEYRLRTQELIILAKKRRLYAN